MRLAGQVTVITGGGSGIGAALARRFAVEGAGGIVVADRDLAAAAGVADAIGPAAAAVQVDVADEQQVTDLVAEVEQRYGRIDLFCANAGVAPGTGLETASGDWQRTWEVNVLAHVYAACAVLPGMLARGEGGEQLPEQ